MSADLTRRLAAWFFLAFAGVGALNPYLSLALSRAGVPDARIPVVLAVFPICSVFAGPLWGVIADRGRPLTVLRLAAAGAAMAGLALPWVGAGPLVVALFVLAFCRAGLTPLVDALLVRSLGPFPRRYGRIRLWGSLGYIGGAVATGALLDAWAAAPFVLAAAFIATSGGLALRLPPPPKFPRGWPEGVSLGALMAVCALQGLIVAVYDTFYTLHVDRLGLPAAVATAGIATGVAVEVAAMAASPYLLDRFGARALIVVGVAVSVPRYLLTAWVPSIPVQIATQALHGLAVGAWWVGTMDLLIRSVDDRHRNAAQAGLMAGSYGIGPLTTLALSSYLLPRGGTTALFLVGAGVAAGTTLFALRALRKEP